KYFNIIFEVIDMDHLANDDDSIRFQK
ncbi:MAG: hypothetical protein ACI97R_002052, partial [Candidatus Azotimanducaceae bacterium]